MYYMGSYAHAREKNKILKHTQTGAGEKRKITGSVFRPADKKKEKPLHPCKGLSVRYYTQ